jgi:hypothetical protein
VKKAACLLSFPALLLLALCTLTARAQEEFVPPPAKLLTTFSFRQFSGGVIILRGTLDHYKDSLNFILDTGSGGISLDSSTADFLHLPTQPSDKTIRGIAGIRNVRFSYNNTLHFPGLDVDSLNFHINDYDILSSVYGEHVDGIIGYSFLIRYIVKIDYDSMRLQVYSHGTMKYPKGGALLKPLLANLLIQNARLGESPEKMARFYFDTGAGLCLLLSRDFDLDSLVVGPRRKRVLTQVEGLGGKKQMELTSVKYFRLGPYKFKNVPTYIFEDEYNVTSYPYLGGLIGNDILRRFNLVLNYEKRDIYLTPNSHYRDQFDYSYSGLNFYIINNNIVVTDIMKGSPAEDAGFRENDIILAVGNNFSKNIQTYKTMLQNAGERVKVLTMLTIHVKSIL